MDIEIPTVYIASPYFSDDQRDTVHKIEEILGRLGYKSYSPFRDGITLKPDSQPVDRVRVFQENKRAIEEADIILACTDGKSVASLGEMALHELRSALQAKGGTGADIANFLSKLIDRDPGTIWELGYAHGIGKFAFTFSRRGFDQNVMIAEGVLCHVKSFDEVTDVLVQLRPVAGNLHARTEEVTAVMGKIRFLYKRDYRVF